MSIHCDQPPLAGSTVYVPLRDRPRPVITTTEEAIAYVREILAEIRPWPEEVEVVDAATLEGRLTAVRPGEPDPAAAKMHAIGAAVRSRLSSLEMAVRMPQLALVAGEYAALLWDSMRAFRVTTEEAKRASGTLRQLLLGLLSEAGEDGITGSEIRVRLVQLGQAYGGTIGRITRDALMAHLRLLQRDGLAEANAYGRWRLVPVVTGQGKPSSGHPAGESPVDPRAGVE
jgi:hypothetical protein